MNKNIIVVGAMAAGLYLLGLANKTKKAVVAKKKSTYVKPKFKKAVAKKKTKYNKPKIKKAIAKKKSTYVKPKFKKAVAKKKLRHVILKRR